MGGTIIARWLNAEDKERGRQRVRLRGTRRHYGSAGDPFGRPAGPRVENVSELSTFVLQMLECGGRRRQRPVAKTNYRQSLARFPRMANPDAPPVVTGRSSHGVNTAVASVQQSGLDTPFFAQHSGCAVQGITFTDAAQVNLHTRSAVVNRL